MTLKSQDFEMWSGEDKTLNFTVYDSSGCPAVLSGSGEWILSTDLASGSVIRKTTDDGITMSGCLFAVTLSGSDTENLGGLYYHEAEYINANSQRSVLAVGTGYIQKDSTG